MCSRRTARLSDLAICGRYRAGESRTAICLAAGVSDRDLLAILKRNGVPRRELCEVRAIAATNRLGTLRLDPLREPCRAAE